MNLLKNNRGAAPLTFAIVSGVILATGLLAMRMSFIEKNNQVIRLLNGIEGSYASDIAAWSQYIITPPAGGNPAPTPPTPNGPRGRAQRVQTRTVDITDEILLKNIRRYGDEKLTATIEGNRYCGAMQFDPSPTQFRTCLGETVAAEPEICSDLFNVPGRSSPFFAGVPNGTSFTYGNVYSGSRTDRASDVAPVRVLPFRPECFSAGSILTFNVQGRIDHGGTAPPTNADGNSGDITHHFLTGLDSNTPAGKCTPARGTPLLGGSLFGKSDVNVPVNSMIGVFLDDSDPTGMTPPPGLNYQSSASRNQTRYAPLLRQIFFIGDGRTNNAAIQEFVVPAGATRLFVGIMDCYQWHNNDGALQIQMLSRAP